MIVSEITYPSGQTAIKIQPESGYKYVSNGEIWSNPDPGNNYIILGKTDSVDNWHDTNDEPPTPEPEPTGDLTVNDTLEIPIQEEDDEFQEILDYYIDGLKKGYISNNDIPLKYRDKIVEYLK